jgi:hypothetical protein
MGKLDAIKKMVDDLSDEDRAELSVYLIEVLDPGPEFDPNEEPFDVMIKRRIEDGVTGRVKGIPLEEAMERLRKEFP